MNRIQVIIPDYRSMGVYSGVAWGTRVSAGLAMWSLRGLIKDGMYE